MTLKDNVVSGTMALSLQLDYFNPNIAFFEPVVEHTQLTLDFSLNSSRPHAYLHLEQPNSDEIININISTQMVRTLLDLLGSIQGRHQGRAELMDCAAQYKVENQTGYPIEV